jgi:catechol 2,3-dioxygenase-like lactoylglutathione lyase family enzyme
MKRSVSLVTLAVDDLSRAVRFYQDGLGLPTEGVVKPARDTFWGGYAGYSQDLDMHL